mgnify:CR=1 FL=1
MDNKIEIFKNEQFGEVRTILEGEKVLFCAADVAKALGYTNPNKAVNDHCRAITKRSTPISGKVQSINFIPEGDVYRLIIRSKLPAAEKFELWVFDEVIPTIRKTGGYIPTSESDSDEDIMARAVLVAQKTIKQKNQQIAEQQTRIVELEPKARFADAVAASDGTCLVGELAKMLRQNGMDIGQNRLFRLLQADGYLGKSGSNRNVPTQRAMDLGLFRIKETTVTHADGHTTVSRTPKVTGKGQRYFIDRYWSRAQPSLEAGA